jgi:hypothetical protein
MTTPIYQDAKAFVGKCKLIHGYSDPTQESAVVEDEHGELWHWWESKLEYPENGWRLTNERGLTHDNPDA